MKKTTLLKSLVLISLFFSQPENAFAQGWYSQRKESQYTRKRGGKNKNDLKKNTNSTPQKAADEIKLVTTGSGDTKDNAILSALRSAIEQTYGTFVSANTTLVNDELVKDEIVSISSGNIKNYNVIYESQENGKYTVTVDAVVSIGNLISFAKSKGAETELSGATFAMNLKLAELNSENEANAIANLFIQVNEICETVSLYDYSIEVSEPRLGLGNIDCDAKITISPNKNAKAIEELIHTTFSALSISKVEALSLKKLGKNPTALSLNLYTGITQEDFIDDCLDFPQKRDYILRNKYDFSLFAATIFKYKHVFKLIDDLGEYSPLIITGTMRDERDHPSGRGSIIDVYNYCKLKPLMMKGDNIYSSDYWTREPWYYDSRKFLVRAEIISIEDIIEDKRRKTTAYEKAKENSPEHKSPIYNGFYDYYVYEGDLEDLKSFRDLSLENDKNNYSVKDLILRYGKIFESENILIRLYYTQDEISKIKTIKIEPYI